VRTVLETDVVGFTGIIVTRSLQLLSIPSQKMLKCRRAGLLAADVQIYLFTHPAPFAEARDYRLFGLSRLRRGQRSTSFRFAVFGDDLKCLSSCPAMAGEEQLTRYARSRAHRFVWVKAFGWN
jgi:hypothetical protein